MIEYLPLVPSASEYLQLWTHSRRLARGGTPDITELISHKESVYNIQYNEEKLWAHRTRLQRFAIGKAEPGQTPIIKSAPATTAFLPTRAILLHTFCSAVRDVPIENLRLLHTQPQR